MTDDTANPFRFPAVRSRKVTAAFDGGRLTSDGGVLLLAQAERAMGICRRLAACIADPRDPGRVIHALPDILRARVFAIACGYEDADDLDALRDDPGFRLALGKLPGSGAGLASQPTMSRWENAPTTRELAKLMAAMIDIYCASYPTSPAAVTLDIDDTCDVVHGYQQLSFWNGHHGERCFLPIHVYDTASGRPVAMLLRTGKTPSGAEAAGHIRRLVRHIRRHWPDTHLTIRGDGHYGRPEVMAFCEAYGIDYVFGLPTNAALRADPAIVAVADTCAVKRAEEQRAINSGIKKIFILTQFNSFSLNRHLARTYNFGDGMNFGDGFVEVLAATQTPGEAGKKWFQGTADAVRQFIWVFEDAKNKNVEHILILSGDHLYRMDYLDFVQKHIDTNADITVSCIPMDESRASDYGLMKIDQSGRIIQFAEKPKGPDLEAMQVDTSILGLSELEAMKSPYIASMGVYVFRTDVLLKLLRWSYPSCNDFGSEIIPSAVREHNVQAYLFNDYWEDIGTVKSFFDANLALTEQPPKFEFNDPKTPFYTSPRFLPPTKVEKCRIIDAIVSHGCFLRECSVQHSIVGVRSRLESGVELKDTMMMGADYYQTESEIASLVALGKVPVGVGSNTKIWNCIIDKNAKIGRNVMITNADGVEEADRAEEGFYIRSGITVVLKNATIKDGTVV